MKTILEMLNDVLSQSGFLRKSQYFNSSDPDDIQMTAIANRALLEITGFYTWSPTKIPFEINLNTGQNVYALPADLKWIISDSSWETDGSRKVDDHVSDAEWYQYKFSSLTSGGTIRARIYGNEIQVIEPFNGGKISFEYISTFAVRSSSGEVKEQFTLDTDTYLLDDQLLTLGIQAHWMQTKLMPQYTEMMSNYFKKMNEAVGRDGVRNTIGGVGQQQRRAPYTKTWVN